MATLPTKATPRLSGYGAAAFADPGDFECAFDGANLQLTVTASGEFKARLTWMRFRDLHVLCGSEELPRIAFVSLSPSRLFVSFPTGKSSLVWDGIALQSGDIVLHARGERMHQRTTAEGRWGLISISPSQLASCTTSAIGRRLTWPAAGRVLLRQPMAAARLLRLHGKASRLAESSDKLLGEPGFARSLEQELLHALVDCLAVDEPEASEAKRRRHADVMDRFEETLRSHSGRRLTIVEICTAIGVPERTLRVCCAEFLGMSPTRFLLLRRLNMVRSALKRADPAGASVSAIARSYQFSELGRFAVIYRTVFGEMPSATLKR
jgi:AraC-like DNA-binding protein